MEAKTPSSEEGNVKYLRPWVKKKKERKHGSQNDMEIW